ncbi:MAG: efflux RND transporter periplasmic adaptor subunit [Candidatus Synoicihabitans palmerolidicus]|nr:efflux RND transporter periplasmic adaptor subunit [Candidatus Synoicihabitans palmerolidicus]
MSPSKRTGIIQLVLVIIFISVSLIATRLMQNGYNPAGRNGGGSRELFVDTAELHQAPYQIVFDTTGTVEARVEINIVPQVSGRVIGVNDAFYTGGAFEADTSLFQIDPRNYELDLRRLQAEVARAQTSLDLAAAESQAATAEWTQLHGDEPAPDLVARRPQLAEAQAFLQSAQAQLTNAALALSRTHFTLPFIGRVLTSRIASGQYVQAGQSYGDAFDLASLDVVASLKGRQLSSLLASADASVRIATDHLGTTRVYDGILKRSAPSLDPVTRFAAVRFGFKSPLPDLLPGVFTRITVNGPEMPAATIVPSAALQQEDMLWLVNDDDTLRPIIPDIIFTDATSIAVRNLPPSATVVTNRISGASAGMKVSRSGAPTAAVIAPSTPAE